MLLVVVTGVSRYLRFLVAGAGWPVGWSPRVGSIRGAARRWWALMWSRGRRAVRARRPGQRGGLVRGRFGIRRG